MSDKNLDALLKMAGVSPGARQIYFGDCRLLAGWVIAVPDAEIQGYIERQFGEVLRACRPVTLTVLTPEKAKPTGPSYLNAKGKAAWALSHATQDKLV